MNQEGFRLSAPRPSTKPPAHCFQLCHQALSDQIQQIAGLPLGFNNALIECYTNDDATMAFHSDQALDMVDESFIAVFTCYKHPELEPQRKLVVQLKDVPEDQAEAFEVPLLHNGVVVFSTETNRRFKHKIVLDSWCDG